MKIKSVLRLSILSVTILCLSSLSMAQGGPGGPGGPDPDPTGSSVPFDFGLGIFVAAGLGYAAKKRLENRAIEKGDAES